jgi:hypothetical protein
MYQRSSGTLAKLGVVDRTGKTSSSNRDASTELRTLDVPELPAVALIVLSSSMFYAKYTTITTRWSKYTVPENAKLSSYALLFIYKHHMR